MSNSKTLRIMAGLILLLTLLGLGWLVYNAGIAQGAAAGIQLPAGEEVRTMPTLYPHPGMFFFGMGIFKLFVFLFLLGTFFWALRAVFGWMPHGHHGRYWAHPGMCGPRHMFMHGAWDREVPEFFDEWHHAVHEKESHPEAEKKED